MSISGLPGLPFTIPGIGFLIGHISFRIITRKVKTKSKIIGVISIITLILFVLAQIELLNFLSYNSFIVCAASFFLWVLIEFILMKVLKKKANTM